MRWVAESRVEGPHFTLMASSAPVFNLWSENLWSEEGASGPCLSSVQDPYSPYREAPSRVMRTPLAARDGPWLEDLEALIFHCTAGRCPSGSGIE